MIKVAVVGNIASGKSLMEKVLDKNGFVVFDTDMIAHDLLIDTPDIAKAFSEYDVFEYGRLSREKLGKLVFSESDLRVKLESIMHPMIKSELENAFKVYSDEKFIFVSVPLLFEAGWESMFDKIVFIKSDDELRLKRLIQRNGYSEQYAKIRLNSQLPQDEKCSKSDYVIENNGSVEEFEQSINEFISSLSESL